MPPTMDYWPRRTVAVGRISIAVVIAWTALVAIPGALPWVATDDSARALALGIVIASVVAVAGLLLAWFRADELGDEGATIGTAASLAALGLAGLEVVNLMIVPADASYRLLATGIGLLVLIAIALGSVAAVRTSAFAGMRVSWLTVIGAVVGIVIVAAYLLMLQTMVTGAGRADDAEWSRLTTLLGFLQTLVFAGLGALLGTVLQQQVTSGVKRELGTADDALDLIERESREIAHEVRQQAGQASSETDAALLDALRQDPSRFRTDAALQRWIRANRPESADSLSGLADSLDQVVASARRIRAG